MPEPTSTATVTIATAAAAVPALTAFGVSLGLRPDLLVAGFSGGLVAIILLNTVPGTGDTWLNLLRTSLRRMCVACASAATAGYMTPLALVAANVPDSMLLSMAFLVGSGAQHTLVRLLRKFNGQQAGEGAQ